MTSFSHRDDTVQLLKETAPIAEVIGEHVKLTRSGTNLKGLCPFHAEKTSSFMVNPGNNSFHCFGCNEGGDVFTFMMKYHRISFPEALKELARKYNIPLPERTLSPEQQAKSKQREALLSLNDWAAGKYHQLLLSSPQAAPARKYLSERGLSENTVKAFRLGYAPDEWGFLADSLPGEYTPTLAVEAGLIVARDRSGFYDRFRSRILFPITGLTGRTIGFGGRILGDGQPKYLNSPETAVFDKSRTLFGLFENRDFIRKSGTALIVEGNFDLVSLVEHGIENVVAPLGTALTRYQVRTLKGYAAEAILLFDGDQAGLKAALRAVPIFLSEKITARVVVLPDNHDPDTFIATQGKEAFEKLLTTAQSLADFVFESLAEQHGVGLEGKAKIIEELQPIIATLGDKDLEKTIFISHFSEKLGVPIEKMSGKMTEIPPKPQAAPSKKRVETKIPIKHRQLLEFLLVCPEYLDRFFDAGVEEVISFGIGCDILELLKQNREQSLSGPEYLLNATDPQIKNFVSKLLIESPSYSKEIEASMAEEMIAWLKKSSRKTRREKIIQKINEAHHSSDKDLYLELMAQLDKT
ncbi:MAG: DNA primase [Proteobacteria bacterium]|nr:DNA primase [Pseudomonadota bacterium]MBU1709097.1 DNA primase [Pseudomonadota bacterium]